MSTSASNAGSSLKSILTRRDGSLYPAQVTFKVAMLLSLVALGAFTFMGSMQWGLIAAGALWLGGLLVLGGALAPEVLIALGSLPLVPLVLYVQAQRGNWIGDGADILIVVFLSLLAAAAPFVFPRYRANRGVTALYAQIGTLMGASVVALSPWVGFELGVLGIGVVVFSRGGGLVALKVLRARLRSQVVVGQRATKGSDYGAYDMDLEKVRQGYEHEFVVGGLLAQLDDSWHVMHSRRLPGTNADVDNLVVGLPGVLQIDAKDYAGTITAELVMPDPVDWTDEGDPIVGEPYERYVLNGDPEYLENMLAPVVFEAHTVREALNIAAQDLRVIVVFGERMTLDDRWMVVGAEGVPVYLTTTTHLLDLIATFEDQVWRLPGRVARRRMEPGEAEARANRDYVADLAAVADYMLPPKL